MLEAAFEGDNEEIIQILKEVQILLLGTVYL
jgi:hypothetical protein